ncbi:hypothetical protein, partial [Plasmodium yoelii yoelii]
YNGIINSIFQFYSFIQYYIYYNNNLFISIMANYNIKFYYILIFYFLSILNIYF